MDEKEYHKMSIVLPVYNEEAGIERLLSELELLIDKDLEFIIVNDGSTDNTLSILKSYQLKKQTSSKKLINLARNFGHQQALMCGLSNVSKDADHILVMDSDFQDKPEDVPLLLNKIEQGYDCVYAVRTYEQSGFLNFILRVFYKIQTKIASFDIPLYAGVFSVFNRNVLDKILLFKEKNIYFPGLRAYVGYQQTGVSVDRGKRDHGRSRVGIKRLIDLSLIAMLDFSAAPIRFISSSGAVIMFLCMIGIVLIFFLKIFGITKIPGITTILMFMMAFAGIQIMFLGIVGEYIVKILGEAKKRPLWIIKDIIT